MCRRVVLPMLSNAHLHRVTRALGRCAPDVTQLRTPASSAFGTGQRMHIRAMALHACTPARQADCH
jgi:hypothetical protein